MTDIIQILIIDDDPDMVDLIAEHLGDLQSNLPPFHLTKKSGAVEALGVVQTTKFDLIFTDFKMPGMDGLEFLTKIRQSEETNESVPVLFVSGFLPAVQANTPQKTLEMVFFLAKPYTLSQFKRAVLLALAKDMLARHVA